METRDSQDINNLHESIATLNFAFHDFKVNEDLHHESFLKNFQNLHTITESFSHVHHQTISSLNSHTSSNFISSISSLKSHSLVRESFKEIDQRIDESFCKVIQELTKMNDILQRMVDSELSIVMSESSITSETNLIVVCQPHVIILILGFCLFVC
jgi:hypothetical protein